MSKPETPNTKTEPRTDAKTDAKPEPKAEAPRFDMPAFQIPGYEQWAAAARDNLARLQANVNAYWNELSTFENAMYERAKQATADLASLANESIQYVSALSAEWRKLSLDATRRFADQMTRN